MTDELEDLVALIDSDGWKRLVAYAAQRYGAAAYRQTAHQIIGNTTVDPSGVPQNATLLMLQLEARTQAVDDIMRFPTERIKFLQAKKETHATAR